MGVVLRFPGSLAPRSSLGSGGDGVTFTVSLRSPCPSDFPPETPCGFQPSVTLRLSTRYRGLKVEPPELYGPLAPLVGSQTGTGQGVGVGCRRFRGGWSRGASCVWSPVVSRSGRSQDRRYWHVMLNGYFGVQDHTLGSGGRVRPTQTVPSFPLHLGSLGDSVVVPVLRSSSCPALVPECRL